MKKLLRLLFRIFLLLVIIVAGIVAVKTAGVSSRQTDIDTIPATEVSEKAAERFSRAIQIPTISEAAQFDSTTFLDLDTLIRRQFPLIDSLLERINISSLSMTFKWPGKNPDLLPVLLMGHADVVPVEENTEQEWEAGPFSGAIKDGYIWGRGTLDDKVSIFGILESIEQLLSENYIPGRSIYLSFGHDEETNGEAGAKKIAAWFQQENIQFEYILDEGMVIVEEAVAGLKPPAAIIGIAEKGYVSLRLTAKLDEGGHSSMPPKQTAIGVLSQAIVRLQETPFPAKIDGASAAFFDHIAPEMSWPFKALFSNRWLTEGILVRQLSKETAPNAIIRTTTAPTMISGGIQDNVLPSAASAVVNFRILPGETPETVAKYVEKIIKDQRMEVSIISGSNPSNVSDTESFGYQVIQKSIQEVFADVVVAPNLLIGQTDSRHYQELSENIYRFLPVRLTKEDLTRIHGKNERISVEGYHQVIRFYRQLVLNSGK